MYVAHSGTDSLSKIQVSHDAAIKISRNEENSNYDTEI
jgi:hypothetical protein